MITKYIKEEETEITAGLNWGEDYNLESKSFDEIIQKAVVLETEEEKKITL